MVLLKSYQRWTPDMEAMLRNVATEVYLHFKAKMGTGTRGFWAKVYEEVARRMRGSVSIKLAKSAKSMRKKLEEMIAAGEFIWPQ